MATINRIKAGRKSKANGQAFENLLKGSAWRQGFECIQLPLGAKQVSAAKLIRVRMPFDFIFCKSGRAIFTDAKSTVAKSFSFAAMTDHQVDALAKIEKQGFTAGYTVYFSSLNRVVFFHASQLTGLQRRSSLSIEDGVILGTCNEIDLTILLSGPPPPR